ncbi:MAG: tetratricopeptide repeat protein, partial [Acidocella sp.]|nr:tetratricopeptide repeat protein [Acidocella sp.]
MTSPDSTATSAARTSPEQIMRAIFTQAFKGSFTGTGLSLPPGASKAGLRAGLALDESTLARLYQEARATARGDTPMPKAPRATRRAPVIIAAGLGLIAVLAILFGVVLVQPWRPTAGIYALAAHNPGAFALLRRRASLSDHQAQFDVGTLLDGGWLKTETVVPKNNRAAFAWYHKAAAAGLAPAQNSLGYLYQTGAGVPRNLARALFWYQKAAEQGFAIAQNNLGAAYQIGAGTAQNYAAAAAWFQRAAAQNEPNAENRLAYLYFRGLGVKQSNQLARHWFAAAAAQGLAPAQLNLGLLYALGIGVTQNDTK